MSNILKLQRLRLDIDEFENKSNLDSNNGFFSQHITHSTFTISDGTEYEYQVVTNLSIDKVKDGKYQYRDDVDLLIE